MLKLKLHYFGHLMGRTDSLEKTLMLGKIAGGRRRGWQRMRWLDGITDSMDMSLSKVGDGQGGLACCSAWGHKEPDTTWVTELNWMELIRNSTVWGATQSMSSAPGCWFPHLLWVWLLAAHSWFPSRNCPPQQETAFRKAIHVSVQNSSPSPPLGMMWEHLPVWGCFRLYDSPFCSDIITVHGVPLPMLLPPPPYGVRSQVHCLKNSPACKSPSQELVSFKSSQCSVMT